MVNSEVQQFVIAHSHFSVLKPQNDTENFCMGILLYPSCVSFHSYIGLFPQKVLASFSLYMYMEYYFW